MNFYPLYLQIKEIWKFYYFKKRTQKGSEDAKRVGARFHDFSIFSRFSGQRIRGQLASTSNGSNRVTVKANCGKSALLFSSKLSECS